MYILFGRGRIASHPSSDWFNSYNLIGSLRNIHSNVIRRASPGRVVCAHARYGGTKNEFI
jgi:hypothetical protein